MLKVKNNNTTEIETTLTKHAWPREVIEHVKHKLYSVKSGKISFFNETKWSWFIMPNDWSKDIYVQDFKKSFKTWENINYIEINNEAIAVDKGIIKSKSISEDSKVLFITPDDWGEAVVLTLDSNNDNIKDTTITIEDFNENDEVEFVANKKWIVVALKKK